MSALIVATALALVAMGLTAITKAGATAPGSAAAPPAAASHVVKGHTMAAAKPVAFGDDPDGDGYIPANPPVTGVTPSQE
ncbi:hypothetical protein G3M55_33875, partial [Streptomyces sp. SID8455]|nr:hypothetical protein [Streptomyces sp. SID8455]